MKPATLRIFVILFGICLIAWYFVFMSSGFSGPSILSLEDHSKLTENGLKDNPSDVRDAWIREAKLIVDKIEPTKEEDIVDIDEAFSIFKEKGAKGVTDLKKKWVRFPNMSNTLLQTTSAVTVMAQYQKGNVNPAGDSMVNTGLTGTNHLPVFLPGYFWKKIQEAAQEAGLKDIRIAWGVRDHNLQAVMFVRSVFSACGAYPSSASQSCMSKVGKTIAGKPGKLGYTHFFSADIDDWQLMKKQLLDGGFACGCSGVGEKDKRHVTWNMSKHDASIKCSVSEMWNKLF
jgi:hypothetical protein